jgi:hypothetical protein
MLLITPIMFLSEQKIAFLPYHHRACYSLSTHASSRSPRRSPVLSPLEHRLEQCRTATLSATSLSSPPPICAPSCEHEWHSSPHSHVPTTPLFVLLLDVRRVLFPALSETVNCRATSLASFALRISHFLLTAFRMIVFCLAASS